MSEGAEQIGEKRTVILTEKGKEDHKTRNMNARKRKVSQLAAMIKQMDELMQSDTNADIVKNKLRVDYHRLHQEFCDINAVLKNYMDEEEYVDDQNKWFEPKNKYLHDYFWRCENWMINVLKQGAVDKDLSGPGATAHEPTPKTEHITGRATQVDLDVRSTTSSKRSKHSQSSKASSRSTASMRMKTAMERAALKVKASALKEKLAIEREEAEILAQKKHREAQEKLKSVEFEMEQKRIETHMKAKKEMHEIQTALAESEAKMEVLEKYNSQTVNDPLDFTDDEEENDGHIKHSKYAAGPVTVATCWTQSG
ncbi:unnamed protein product [Knipowitschia caucasica]